MFQLFGTGRYLVFFQRPIAAAILAALAAVVLFSQLRRRGRRPTATPDLIEE